MSKYSVLGDQLIGAEKISHLPYRDKVINPRYIAIHYTAGGSLDSSIGYLRKKGYSYQLLIDRDGRVVQGTPLNKRASHAGYSNWKGLDSLNDYSIGISLANLGYLDRHGSKYYRTNSHGDPSTPIFDENEVVKARHWNGHNGSTVKGWERYTPEQYDALYEVCQALLGEFKTIVDVISHEEFSVGRKPDPGMSFEWTKIRPMFPGRKNDLGPLWEVDVPENDNLHVRRGPNGTWGVKDKLENGRKVHIRSYAYVYKGGTPVKSVWASIALERELEHLGFVHSGYLNRV